MEKKRRFEERGVDEFDPRHDEKELEVEPPG